MLNNLQYFKTNSVNSFLCYYQLNKWLFSRSKGKKYLALVAKNESKEIFKKWRCWSKTKDKIGTKSNNSDDCDEKYMKIKFNLDDDLNLNKTLELHNMTIVVRAFLHRTFLK